MSDLPSVDFSTALRAVIRGAARTRFGSLYDWTVDVTMATAIVALRWPPFALAFLLPLVFGQVLARRDRLRVSMRAALTLAALVLPTLQRFFSHG